KNAPKCFFFFFQAEDGIRDRNVTGVQTCALPILVNTVKGYAAHEKETLEKVIQARNQLVSGTPQERLDADNQIQGALKSIFALRSEERRVGKKYRSRCGDDQRTSKKTEGRDATMS